MTEATEMTPGPQRLQALARANEVRLARAGLKRRIAQGQISAADVIIACPEAASSWSVGELLMTQRRWGVMKCRKFLARNQISEIKTIGKLTDRQRRLLAEQLKACEPPAHDVRELARPLAPEPQHQRELARPHVSEHHHERELERQHESEHRRERQPELALA
jgi:hypothetical protein